MPLPERDNERAARALVDAYFTTDKQAADKHGISTRSIERYRAKLEKDGSLSGLYGRTLEAVLQRPWAEELGETLTTALRRIKAELSSVEIKTLDDMTRLIRLTQELVELEMSRMYAEADTKHDGGHADARQSQSQGGAAPRPTAPPLNN